MKYKLVSEKTVFTKYEQYEMAVLSSLGFIFRNTKNNMFVINEEQDVIVTIESLTDITDLIKVFGRIQMNDYIIEIMNAVYHE